MRNVVRFDRALLSNHCRNTRSTQYLKLTKMILEQFMNVVPRREKQPTVQILSTLSTMKTKPRKIQYLVRTAVGIRKWLLMSLILLFSYYSTMVLFEILSTGKPNI